MSNYDDAIRRICYLEDNYARLEDRLNTLDRTMTKTVENVSSIPTHIQNLLIQLNEERYRINALEEKLSQPTVEYKTGTLSEIRNKLFSDIEKLTRETVLPIPTHTIVSNFPELKSLGDMESVFSDAEFWAACKLDKKEFIELVRRGGATWMDCSVEMKEFIDLVTVGHVQQNYRAMEK